MNEVATSYLRFPMVVSELSVTVHTPDGRKVGKATSVKQARLIVRGYRKACKEEAF